MFTYVYSCLLIVTPVDLHLLMFSRDYLCLPLFACACLPMFDIFTRVYLCLHLFTYAYHSFLVLSFNVYSCLPMFTCVYLCLHFTYVYPLYCCLPMFTPVYSCLPMFTNFTRVYLSLLVFNCVLVFT